jgi:imidazolonepropionase-like amidohydrolase
LPFLPLLLSCVAPLGAADAETRDDPSTVAFVGARLVPVAGPEIASGVLVIRDGVIVHIGSVDETPIPASADVRDVTGRVILPGLIDTHSHVGGGWGGDTSSPIQPEVRVLDSIDARHPGFQRAQAGGITTANVMSGSGLLMSGQTLYLKLRDGTTIEDLLVRDEEGRIAGGMKMANGTNSQRKPPHPGTRAKSAALVRARFLEARAYREKLAAGEEVERDLALEAMVELLEGRRVVHHHTHRHDDILTVIRLAQEFGLRVVLHHVSDAWKVADEIAAAGLASSIIVVDSPGGKLEARDIKLSNGAALERAGAEVAFHTDDFITDSRLFLRAGALAVRAGMSREKALEALTLAPARMLDLDDRLGSLEVGKDADLVILDGDPFSVYTKVLETWVEGARVFDRSDEKDRLYAVGGRGAGWDFEPRCCGGGER